MRLRMLFKSAWDRPPLTPAEVRLRGLIVLVGGPAFAAVVAVGTHLAVWAVGEWLGQRGTVIGVGLLLITAVFAFLTAAAGLAEVVTGVEAGEWAARWQSLPARVRLVVMYGTVLGLGGGGLLYVYYQLPVVPPR